MILIKIEFVGFLYNWLMYKSQHLQIATLNIPWLSLFST